MGIGDVVIVELRVVGFFKKGSLKVTNLRHRTIVKPARTHVKRREGAPVPQLSLAK